MGVIALGAMANYSFLNFVKSENSGVSVAATGTKITFSGNTAIVTSGAEVTQVAMGGIAYLEFGNVKLNDNNWLKGDVNGDGLVNITDVNCLINIILGAADASDYDGRANVNGDGTVNVSDVNVLIGIIAGV